MHKYVIVNGELYHHGIKGMKWGVRKKEKIDKLRSTYRSKNETSKTHYNSSIKLASKARDASLSKKDRRNAALFGAYQYNKGKEYEKQAKTIQRKLKRKGVTVTENSKVTATRVAAGELYVKKMLPRRAVEKTSEVVWVGAQFAAQTALMGRPMMAISSEHSPYKLKGE